MSHDRRPLSREEEEYYYHQRAQSQGGSNGFYDDSQGNPYAFYSQPQAPPDHGRNGPYPDHAVARDRDRERHYARNEDSDSVSCSLGQPCSLGCSTWYSFILECPIALRCLDSLLTVYLLC